MPSDNLKRSEAKTPPLRFPVIAEGAEHLVMGYLMRRNILAYKAPPLNEGYDLICIHPQPRHRPKKDQKAQLRIQVKSRYASDALRGFPIKKESLSAFDYLVIVFLNIGNFKRGSAALGEASQPEFYTIPQRLIKRWHDDSTTWQKVVLRNRLEQLQKYRDDLGFEQIAVDLGVPRPSRPRA